MKKFKHLSFIERCNLKEALESDIFKKKNGTLNISKIARYMGRSKSTIKYHLKHYKHIKRYHPMQEHKRYLENRKNCKKKTTLTFKQLLWLDEKFNKFHYTPLNKYVNYMKLNLMINSLCVLKHFINIFI